jgi:hypothetical protein
MLLAFVAFGVGVALSMTGFALAARVIDATRSQVQIRYAPD